MSYGRIGLTSTSELQLICIVVWHKPMQHCKAIFLQLKNKLKKNKTRECGAHQAITPTALTECPHQQVRASPQSHKEKTR